MAEFRTHFNITSRIRKKMKLSSRILNLELSAVSNASLFPGIAFAILIFNATPMYVAPGCVLASIQLKSQAMICYPCSSESVCENSGEF